MFKRWCERSICWLECPTGFCKVMSSITFRLLLFTEIVICDFGNCAFCEYFHFAILQKFGWRINYCGN